MTDTTSKKTAGAFDVRNIIGALLGIYGVILVVMGLFGDTDPASPDAPSGGGDVNANLWAGLGLLVVAAVFLIWSRVRPIVVPDHVDKDMERPGPAH
jgi:drug/metabolite transporter (DMT)-like permease